MPTDPSARASGKQYATRARRSLAMSHKPVPLVGTAAAGVKAGLTEAFRQQSPRPAPRRSRLGHVPYQGRGPLPNRARNA